MKITLKNSSPISFFLLCFALFLLFITPANSGSLPTNNTPTDTNNYHARSTHWHGGYAGLTIGAAGLGADIDQGSVNNLEIRRSGATFGGFIGYNFAHFWGEPRGAQGWMFGLEAEAMSLPGGKRKTGQIVGPVNFDASWMGSARIRSGYAWQRLFLYGTVGLAISDIKIKASKDNDIELRAGLAFGIGAEFKINENWSTRLEAIGYSFGENDTVLNGAKRDSIYGASVVRIGVSRSF